MTMPNLNLVCGEATPTQKPENDYQIHSGSQRGNTEYPPSHDVNFQVQTNVLHAQPSLVPRPTLCSDPR